MSSHTNPTSSIRGAFLGLAVCDALGAPAEFNIRGSFATITSMQPNLNFGLGPGHFTDDTSMALCLAHSLLESGLNSDSTDQARKYLAWYRTGYQSSTGRCFDIGNLTRDALGVWKHAIIVDDQHGEKGSSPNASKSQLAVDSVRATIDKRFNHNRYCGNGSLMRVLPVALIFAQDLPTATKAAAESSKVTHPHPRCVLSCALYTILIAQVLQEPNLTKSHLVEYISHYVSVVKNAMAHSAAETKSGSSEFLKRFELYNTLDDFHHKQAKEIRSTGYVLDSLEAALWAFFTTSSFREGAIKVVNLGDDADTVGAIYGGLAGAFYSDTQIPQEWLRDMKRLDLLENAVEKIISKRPRNSKQSMSSDARVMIQASVDVLDL